MGEINKNLLNMLTEFIVCEVGSKVLDGITYTLLLKDNENDRANIERYKKIKIEAANCGFVSNEVFRVYEVGNGFIFDLDISIAKMITAQLAKSAVKERGKNESADLIKDLPEQRRKKDLIALSKYLVKQIDNNKREVEVALFSKNTTNKIVINAMAKSGEAVAVMYNAFALRHWDIELLNAKLLIPQGLRVSRIQPYEVLPSKTGVSFLMTLEKMG